MAGYLGHKPPRAASCLRCSMATTWPRCKATWAMDPLSGYYRCLRWVLKILIPRTHIASTIVAINIHISHSSFSARFLSSFLSFSNRFLSIYRCLDHHERILTVRNNQFTKRCLAHCCCCRYVLHGFLGGSGLADERSKEHAALWLDLY